MKEDTYIFDTKGISHLLDTLKLEVVEILNNNSTDSDKIAKIKNIKIDLNKHKKRHRAKNIISDDIRCHAKRADGAQCSRKKRDGSMFCGTHIKGCPHGEFKKNTTSTTKTITTIAIDIGGIYYYKDSDNNIYNTEDVHAGKNNPQIIGKYDNGKFLDI